MVVSYDEFAGAFLSKITDYDLNMLTSVDEQSVVDGYMRRALSNTTFKKVCDIKFMDISDDKTRTFNVPDSDAEYMDEIIDIVSEGMLEQWLKPYVYQQDLLRNVLNTRDYTMFSPAELVMRVGNAYKDAHKNYLNLIREYSYNHGDLSDLHL